MNIGIYHIELWHLGAAVPNLELMKIYNYYYQKGHKITMIKPKEDLGRYDQIFYFKDNPNTILPKTFQFRKDRRQLLGYGFYKKTNILKPEIFSLPPLYYIYDPFTNKLKWKNEYERMKKNSYIRVETNDFVDFKPNANKIYIADNDFCLQEKALDFLEEYKQYSYFFLRPLKLSTKQLDKFARYSNLLNRDLELTDFNGAAFLEYSNETRIAFPYHQFKKENDLNYTLRLVKMGLLQKYYGTAAPALASQTTSQKSINQKILKWIVDRNRLPMKEFYKDDKEVQDLVLVGDSELRLLLRANPLTLQPQHLDLQNHICYN